MVIFSHVVVDCYDPQTLAQFWADVMGSTILYDWEEYVVVEGTPRLAFQHVLDPTPGKNRLHLDVLTDDLAADTERLRGLGATFVERVSMRGGTWHVLTDPEGNQFCLAEPFDLSSVVDADSPAGASPEAG